MTTDREWMYNSRFLEGRKQLNPAFIGRVESFVDYATQQPTTDKDNDKIRCPCRLCKNRAYKLPDQVKEDILSKGFVKYYDSGPLMGNLRWALVLCNQIATPHLMEIMTGQIHIVT